MSGVTNYLARTGKVIRDGTFAALRMEGSAPPSRAPKTMFTFNSAEDLRQYALGCDADNGGMSTAHLDLDTTTAPRPTGKFWGEMRLGVRPGSKIPRGGYAAVQNKTRDSFFGAIYNDKEFHEYLALRLRLAGDPRTYESYFVNLQVQTAFTTELWQHRLYFSRNDNQWEDIFIPFRNFVRTNAGMVTETRINMADKIKNVGIALLGGHSNAFGKYELGIDSIRMVNEEDVTAPPRKPDPEVDPSEEEEIYGARP